MVHIGDMVPKAGMFTNPGVVTERKEDGTVTIDTEPMQINKFHRYSNTTGLSEDDKLAFNSILDRIYQNPNREQRIGEIQTEIDGLRTDPKNRGIVQYLKNQQKMLIRDTGAQPRVYNLDEDALGNGIQKSK